jgi:catechol 2,3-dioxygenase-like lactoylglutathione lyase family enzyme
MPHIGPITAVTIAAPELQRMIDTYQLYLGYELVEHGRVTPAQAGLWGRPALVGRRYGLMLPEGEGRTFMRFVESRPEPGYVPFRHYGWNAAELMVQDTDAVGERLARSPFKVIGPPANLSFTDKIRAMQVLGPASESLYLTAFKEKMAEFDVPEARHFVDRVFIVILGGQSIADMNSFYTRHFGAPRADVLPAVISVMSNAFGIPADSKHDLAAVGLSGQSYIEIDAMPTAATPRPGSPDELPPGISMISFAVEALPTAGLPYLSEPAVIAQAPYYGKRAAVCVGAAGELVELIEA